MSTQMGIPKPKESNNLYLGVESGYVTLAVFHWTFSNIQKMVIKVPNCYVQCYLKHPQLLKQIWALWKSSVTPFGKLSLFLLRLLFSTLHRFVASILNQNTRILLIPKYTLTSRPGYRKSSDRATDLIVLKMAVSAHAT